MFFNDKYNKRLPSLLNIIYNNIDNINKKEKRVKVVNLITNFFTKKLIKNIKDFRVNTVLKILFNKCFTQTIFNLKINKRH